MKIDVIMPVFDTRSDHLLEAVYSILKQSFQDFRLLIIDDGSQRPETIKVLAMLDTLDSRIEIHRFEHAGTPVAMNHGHDLSVTDYVAIMGSDDIAHPLRLQYQVDYLLKKPDTDVLGTGLVAFHCDDPWRKIMFHSIHPRQIHETGFIVNHGTSMYKLSLAKEIGGYKPALLRRQDIDFFNRLYVAGKIIRNIPDVLYWWRRY